MKKWGLLLSGEMPPDENMRADYDLWQAAARGEIPPTLRFYGWSPHAVSLGYNQPAEGVINTEFCKDRNIPVVKRPTGGSAIFHDIELTYSFCANIHDHPSFAEPTGSYFAVCGGIAKGLEKLGVNLGARGYSSGKEPSFTARDCFSLTSRHDLVVQGRKVVGSAQRRNKNAFLQHGSMLLDIRKDLWESIFCEAVDFSKIVCLKELLKEPVSADCLQQILKDGFQEAFSVEFG